MRRLTEEQRQEQARLDLLLVRRSLSGKPSAVEELVDRLSFVPRAIAAKNAEYGRPLGPNELEDLGQDVLVAIWRRLGDYAGIGTLDAWIYRFCFLHLLSHLRQRRRRHTLLEDVSPDGVAVDPAVACAAEEDEGVYAALEHVGPPDADVVRLKHMDELTFEEIGRRLGISPNTAKGRYYRCLKRLRRYLQARLPLTERELA